MPVETRGEATDPRAETERCHAKILQLYRQSAACMGVGTQDFFAPVNTHHSLSYPKPLMPNYVQVGGMHVKPPKKLPEVRKVKLM